MFYVIACTAYDTANPAGKQCELQKSTVQVVHVPRREAVLIEQAPQIRHMKDALQHMAV